VIGSSGVSTQSDRLSATPSSANVTRHLSVAAGSTNATAVVATAAAATASTSPSSLHTSGEQHDSFEDFDEDVTDSSPMQPIGTCVALYPFDGILTGVSSFSICHLHLILRSVNQSIGVDF